MALFDVDTFWEILKAVRGESTTGLTSIIEALALAEKTKTNNYFTGALDQIPFDTNDYRRVRKFLIDWYSAHKTMGTISSKSTDPHSMTNENLDELFRSFGFPYSTSLRQPSNEPLESKINLFLDLVNLYKIKGTPQALVEVLQYFGVPEVDIFSYWLKIDSNGELVFEGFPVAGTTIDQANITLDYDLLTSTDPHWLYTQSQILSLNSSNRINLPSQTPYIGIQPSVTVGAETAILSRTIQDQYDSWDASGELPTQNAEITILGETASLLELYLSLIYTFYKKYDVGGTDGTNFVCYDGTATTAQNIISEYDSITGGVVTSRQNILDRLSQYYNTFTRTKPENFLQVRGSAESYLTTMNSALKDSLDALVEDVDTVLNSLLKDLANWVRNNIGFGFINLGFVLSGLQAFFEDINPVINFFKPYRVRIVILENLQFKNRLFGSIVLEDSFRTPDIRNEFWDHVTGDSQACCSDPDLNGTCDSTALNYYSRATFDCGSYFDIGAVTDIRRELFIDINETHTDALRCPIDSTGYVLSEILDINYTGENVQNLLDGDTRTTVGYDVDQSNTLYAIIADLYNDGDETDTYDLIITRKTLTTFSANFSSAINGEYNYISYKVARGTYSGSESIPAGADSLRINFAAPTPSADYSISFNLANYTDVGPTIYQMTVIDKDVNGFTVQLSGATDSGNYKIEWTINDSALSGVDNVPQGRSGYTVTLPTPQTNPYYAVFVNIINTVDGTASFVTTTVRSKTTSSFYVPFSTPTNTANYSITWSIIPQTPEIDDLEFLQRGEFRSFDERASFDCTHGFDMVQLLVQAVGYFLLQEGGGHLLQENGARIKLESSP